MENLTESEEDEVIAEAVRVIFDSSSETSDDSTDESEDSDEEELQEMVLQARGEIIRTPRVQLFVENVVALYDDVCFKSHFRVTRTTCGHLLNVLGAKITQETPSAGHPFTDPMKQILFALWVLGNPESYRSVCNLFNVGKATGIRTVRRVVDALYEIAPKLIKWPRRDEQQHLAERFARKAGFPGVIGCIDGCHIPIQAPKENPESYYNRKSFYSIVLQGVCDVNMIFTHCYVGEVGSAHDSRVLSNSAVDTYLHGRCAEMFADESYHILGDAAYPVVTHLMPPYKDYGNMTPAERNYNYKLSATRMVIERAFGHLKGRWRRLKQLNMARVDLMPKTVTACCVLHNICIMQNDPQFDLEIEEEGEPVDDAAMLPARNDRAGNAKRTRIKNQLPLRVAADEAAAE